MEDTIKQFLALPATIRLAVSSPQAIERLEKIEDHYKVRLADVVIRVVTKHLQLSTLQNEFERQFSFDAQQAKELYDDLMRDIFSQVAGHLGISQSLQTQPSPSSAVHEMSLGEIHTDPDVIAHTQKLKFEPPATYDAAAFATQLAKDLALSIPDTNMSKRFSIIVESRLVDARSNDETKERLQRVPKIGGMGFDDATSGRIVAAIEKEHDRIHAAHLHIIAKDVIPDDKKIGPLIKSPVRHPQMPHSSLDAPKIPDISSQQVKTIPPAAPKPMPPVLESTKTPPLPPGVVMRPKVTTQSIPAFINPPKPVMSPAPMPQPPMPQAPHPDVPHFMPKVFRQDQGRASRPQMQDITTQKKLVGPVEELGQMTIQDFRKLGNSPSESASRLKEMVSILNQESLAQRSAGLKAWRTSPMMREYLQIGNLSMESSQGIEQIIAGLRAKNSLSMTQDEFDIIASLNRSLRY